MTMTGETAAAFFAGDLSERCTAEVVFSAGWRVGTASEKGVRRVKRDRARIEDRSILDATVGRW